MERRLQDDACALSFSPLFCFYTRWRFDFWEGYTAKPAFEGSATHRLDRHQIASCYEGPVTQDHPGSLSPRLARG